MQKKKIKIISILLIVFLLIMYSKSIYATSSSAGYTIQSYYIDMIVNEDNSFDITEKITVNFTTARHGIYRKIPLKNSVKRIDGTANTNRVNITNISVNEKYSLSRENGYQVIKIGDANSTVIGEHTYTIKYKYSIGKDPLKNADELYYNLIGPEWDTSIDKVSFKITMPKEFDKTKLGFSSGKTSSTTNNVYCTINGNVITGNLYTKLNSNESLTVRLTLPEGYFSNAQSGNNSIIYIMWIVPPIFALIAFFLWYKFGKDNKVIETVEFYPPKGYNSAEVGFLYKGKVEDKDVVSLLIYLANKGYISITEITDKNMYKKSNNIKITKLKDNYEGNNESERIFFNGLFKSGNTEITLSDLEDVFYITINKIKNKINSNENKNHIFETSTKGKSILVILMAIISTFILFFIPIYESIGTDIAISALIMSTTFFTLLISVLFSKEVPIYLKITWGIILIPFLTIFMKAFGLFDVILNDSSYTIGSIIDVLSIIGMFIFYYIMPKRTEEGNKLLGQIKGFKNFLETAEKEKLEAMVMENPTYFYDILPYTYVLGISDKWIKQFETISIQSPTWYDSSDSFNISTFGTFMNSTMSKAQTSMISSPSDNSSGGSSGGGFSGGGSGGGGGGSW